MLTVLQISWVLKQLMYRVYLQTCLLPSPSEIVKKESKAGSARSTGCFFTAIEPHLHLPFAVMASSEESIAVLRSLPCDIQEEKDRNLSEQPSLPKREISNKLRYIHAEIVSYCR